MNNDLASTSQTNSELMYFIGFYLTVWVIEYIGNNVCV